MQIFVVQGRSLVQKMRHSMRIFAIATAGLVESRYNCSAAQFAIDLIVQLARWAERPVRARMVAKTKKTIFDADRQIRWKRPVKTRQLL